MSASPEAVPIEFGEVPVIRTREELTMAAGRLITAPYVCLAELDDDVLGGYASVQDPTFTAVYGALRGKAPELIWRAGETQKLHGPPSRDVGLHNDQKAPWVAAAVVYHKTRRMGGGVEATFARAKQAYRPEKKKIDDLTKLLRNNETDPRYVDPDSFQRVRLEQGGTLIFSVSILHMFRTTRAYRFSDATVIGGRL